jgi:hypothetical protein
VTTPRDRLIAEAIQVGKEIGAFRKQLAVLADERSDLLIRLRDEHGMTQQQIGDALGFTAHRAAEIIRRRDFDATRRGPAAPGEAGRGGAPA